MWRRLEGPGQGGPAPLLRQIEGRKPGEFERYALMFMVVAASFFFEKFIEELFDFQASLSQRLFSRTGREVDLATPSLDLQVLGSQPPTLFKTME